MLFPGLCTGAFLVGFTFVLLVLLGVRFVVVVVVVRSVKVVEKRALCLLKGRDGTLSHEERLQLTHHEGRDLVQPGRDLFKLRIESRHWVLHGRSLTARISPPECHLLKRPSNSGILMRLTWLAALALACAPGSAAVLEVPTQESGLFFDVRYCEVVPLYQDDDGIIGEVVEQEVLS